MKPKAYEVVIVGGGLAGIVAAHALKDDNLNVLLLDENNAPGGQFLKTHPRSSGRDGNNGSAGRTGYKCLEELKHSRVNIKLRTKVLEISREKELLVEEEGKGLFTVVPKGLLIATGAREKFLPFKGWTLPGVISTGAAQILVKASGVLPSRKMLIGGGGVFLYAVAAEILKAGGRVQAILDQTTIAEKLIFSSGLLGESGRLKEAVTYLSKIIFTKTPVQHKTRIIEARGDGCLEEVVGAKIDKSGGNVPGSEVVYPCDCLAVGYGLTANIELAQLAGCDLAYDVARGGRIVVTSEDLETTVPSIFAAGEITGVGGALKSITEGRLAAFSILYRFGKISANEFKRQARALTQARNKQLRFGRFFNALHAIPYALIASIPDDTMICRCEDVTMGRIKAAVEKGFRAPVALKRALRTGMGMCQGRICGPVLDEIVSVYTNSPIQQIKPFSVRGPAKAFSLETLAGPIEELYPEIQTGDKSEL
ncbi:FAD-dependent oxidoreductase [Thermodesulfobacteriota bacterium]